MKNIILGILLLSILILNGCSQTVVKYQCADGSFLDSADSCSAVESQANCPELDCSACPVKTETKTVTEKIYVCSDLTQVKSLNDCKTAEQKEIDSLLMTQYQEALKLEKNIIVDMTNMSKKSRKKWLNDSKTSGYFKLAKVFIEPKSVLMSRMTPEKSIPEFVIDSMMKSFVYPNLEEFKRVDLVIKD